MTTTNPGHVLPTPESSSPRPSRMRRRIAALAGGLALVVAAPIAAGTPASAATSTHTTTAAAKPTVKTARTTLKISKHTQTRFKTAAKIRVVVRIGSAKATGKVTVKIGSKTWKHLTLHSGTTKRVSLPKTMTDGKHRITAVYTHSGVKRSKDSQVVKVKKGTSKIVTTAKKYVGKPYRHGATGPKAFDCSGFTSYVFKKAGIKKLPRTSSAQRHVGKTVSRKHAKPGDIIWSPGHVAIYVGGNKMIDAPRPGKTIQVRSIWQHHPKFIRVNAAAVAV